MNKVLETPKELVDFINGIQPKNTIGFVPTMGSLHHGHLSLVERSIAENDCTIVSIFVNPTQFGPKEDFEKYPRNIEKDLSILKDYNIDVVFTPYYKDVFTENYLTFVTVNRISNLFCGKTRSGHFKGVTTIICKFLNLIKPNFLYLGEKDYQQMVIIEKMISDLNYSTKVKKCAIVREPNGLAMSSRNIYLSKKEKLNSTCLYKSLLLAKENYNKGIYSINRVKTQMVDLITKSNGIIDYIAFVHKDTLLKEKHLSPNTRILLAVKIGKTRLIDNIDVTEVIPIDFK